MSYSFVGGARTVRGTAQPVSYATPYAGATARPASTIVSRPTAYAAAPAATRVAPAAYSAVTARPTAYPVASIPTALPTKTIGTVGTFGTTTLPKSTIVGGSFPTIATSSLPYQTYATNSLLPTVLPATTVAAQPVLASGVPTSYTIGGASATYEYLTAGAPVQEVTYDAPAAFTQPAVIETIQPVTEVVIGPSGQPEYVQGAEIVQQVVDQPVMDMGQPMVQGEVAYADPAQAQEQAALAPRVVIVCTSADMLGDHPTGAWSEEITGPFYVFRDAGCEIYFASIAGGPVPIDQGSLQEGMVTENDQRFHEDGGFDLLQNTLPISDIRAEDIDCVWLAGGHGTMVDFEAPLAQFITDAVAYGRPVGAVCHGVAGLLSAIKEDCTPLLQGRQVTAFSNAEEDAVQLSGKVPYLLQSRIEELGAAYSCAAPWQEYALADGPIITGQNPASSVRAAQLCIQAMTPQQ